MTERKVRAFAEERTGLTSEKDEADSGMDGAVAGAAQQFTLSEWKLPPRSLLNYVEDAVQPDRADPPQNWMFRPETSPESAPHSRGSRPKGCDFPCRAPEVCGELRELVSDMK